MSPQIVTGHLTGCTLDSAPRISLACTVHGQHEATDPRKETKTIETKGEQEKMERSKGRGEGGGGVRKVSIDIWKIKKKAAT